MPTEPLKLLALEALTTGQAGYVTDEGVRGWTGHRVPKYSSVVTALQDVGAGEIGRFRERPRPGDAIVRAREDGQYDILLVNDKLEAQVRRTDLTYKVASKAARDTAAQGRRWLSRHDAPDAHERF
jgi:hypothetical protein